MGARRIVIEFLGKDSTLSKTAGQAERSTSRLGNRLATVGKIAAVGFAAGTVVAGKALFEMGKNAAADEAAQRKLAIALKNTTGANDAQVAGVEKWISAQGKALGVTDDELRPSLQRLAQATGDIGEAQRLASLAMDASAGSGKSLETVSTALAKAQAGNMGALSRLGVRIKDTEGKTLSFKQVTEQMADTFGGQASAKANSFDGKMQRLRLILDETKESIGAKLIPVAEKLATWFIDSGLPAISQFSTFMREKLGPVIEWIRGIFSSSTGGMNSDVKKNLNAVRDTFQSVVSIITSLWNRFGGILTEYTVKTLGNIRTVIGGVLQVIAGIFKVFSSLLKGDWKGVWDGIKQITSGALAVLRGLISQAMNLIRTSFRLAWSAITAIVGGAWNGIKGMIASGASSIVASIRAIPGKVRALGGVFRDAGRHLIQQMVDGLKNAGGIISGIAGNVWSAVRALLNKGIDKINSALEFKISLPGPDIHVNPANIPHLAKGGVVKARRGGTLALLGEAGHDEAVVPLSGPHARTGGGDFSVTAPLVLQLDTKTVWQGLLKLKRSNGNTELGLA